MVFKVDLLLGKRNILFNVFWGKRNVSSPHKNLSTEAVQHLKITISDKNMTFFVWFTGK